MKKKTNYDLIAPFYDSISSFVYSNNLRKAQISQLKLVKDNSSILIAGGGTGWILEVISALNLKNIRIMYVEYSAKMIEISKARKFNFSEIQFIQSDIEFYQGELIFDVIITAFLFDNFKETKAISVFTNLDQQLKIGGLWFHTDFTLDHGGGWWKKSMIRLMYLFFKISSALDHSDFIEMTPSFINFKYVLIHKQLYFSKFISGAIFKKTCTQHI